MQIERALRSGQKREGGRAPRSKIRRYGPAEPLARSFPLLSLAETMDTAELLLEDGTTWQLKRGPNKKGEGYLGVAQPRTGEFHARVNVAGMTDGQQLVPGKACKTAQEAALRYAKYMAAPFPIRKKNPDRAEKGHAKVSCVPSRAADSRCLLYSHARARTRVASLRSARARRARPRRRRRRSACRPPPGRHGSCAAARTRCGRPAASCRRTCS